MSGVWAEVAEQSALLPEYLGEHVLLTVTALAGGMLVTAPLAAMALRYERARGPILAVASIAQAVPGMALLALMVPLLNTIGFVPAIVALTLYSILPMLRNAVTGVLDVDPAIVEAARGVGMTPRQRLLKVELPIAAPVIIAGLRTSTVWVVATATLATPVGATSLGNYIFSGLQTWNKVAVVVGCVASAALALSLDGLIRVIEVAASRRSKPLAAVGVAGVLAVVLGGLSPMALRALGGGGPVVTVGAKTFTEQYILADLMRSRLEDAGFDARSLDSLGSTVVFEALKRGRIDAYVDYTGTIWANHMERDRVASADAVYNEMKGWLKAEHGVTALGRLGFQNAYVLAMRESTAAELGVETVADLAQHAPDLTIGGDYEFFQRPEWEAVREAYGLDFDGDRSMDSALMYQAVRTGQVDVIGAFSTDGRIAAYDLRVLEDPKDALPPYDAVILLSPGASENERLLEALGPLIGAIDAGAMRRANKAVDVDGRPIREAAELLGDAVSR